MNIVNMKEAEQFTIVKGHWGSGHLRHVNTYRKRGQASWHAFKLERLLWLHGKDEDQYIGIVSNKGDQWLVTRSRLFNALNGKPFWEVELTPCNKEGGNSCTITL